MLRQVTSCVSLGLVLVGCAGTQEKGHALLQPGAVTLLARDSVYEGPEVIAAGRTVMRLRNLGRQAHQAQLLKLDKGRTPAELLDALRSPVIQIPKWAKQVGGPNAVGGGSFSEAIVDLDPGSYVIVCLVPGEDGTPHVRKGMLRELQVVEGGLLTPHFDYHLAMRDYSFAIPEAMSPGRRTFRVTNRGTQAHEVSLVRLAPGATSEDVLGAYTPGHVRPLPGEFIGGVAAIEPGTEAYFTVDLYPGRYAALCLFPNPHGEAAHLRRGMALTFVLEPGPEARSLSTHTTILERE